MQMILDLQKLEVSDTDAYFGNSCTSSMYTCCNTGRDFCNGSDAA
jgi:hypothetical protein